MKLSTGQIWAMYEASDRANLWAMYGAYHRAMYRPCMELPTGQIYGPCMELPTGQIWAMYEAYMELDFDDDVNDMKADYSVDC